MCCGEPGTTLLTAKAVKEAGGVGLRGDIQTPQSSYSFQGLGQEGLDLQAAKTATGLFIVAEVRSSEDIEIAQDTVMFFRLVPGICKIFPC